MSSDITEKQNVQVHGSFSSYAAVRVTYILKNYLS